MKKNKVILLMCLLSFSISGFNIIPLDETLRAHQKAFKDFELHASDCEVESYHYSIGNNQVSEYNYEFNSLQAKKSFQNYRRVYGKLRFLMYMNSILKASIIGFTSSYCDQFSRESLFNKKRLSLNLLLSAFIVMDENINMSTEPYFDPGSLTKHNNLFGIEDLDTWMRTFIAMFTIEYIRMIGALTCFRNYNKRFF